MADPKGQGTFRDVAARRPVAERIHDWKEVYPGTPGRAVLPIISEQAGRCMDCGIPFLQDARWATSFRSGTTWCGAAIGTKRWSGCTRPTTSRSSRAGCARRLRDRLCRGHQPRPGDDQERRGRDHRQGVGRAPGHPAATGMAHRQESRGCWLRPAGLAAAQQLTRAGHTVVVYERSDAPGGLLRYGIPEFKMEKSVLDRRIRQMHDEGTNFRCGVEVGVKITGRELKERYDAIVLAVGSHRS